MSLRTSPRICSQVKPLYAEIPQLWEKASELNGPAADFRRKWSEERDTHLAIRTATPFFRCKSLFDPWRKRRSATDHQFTPHSIYYALQLILRTSARCSKTGQLTILGTAIDINRPAVLCSLSIVEMKPAVPKKRNTLVIQSAICIWAVAVFLWYFWQFSPVISPLLNKFIRKIWH